MKTSRPNILLILNDDMGYSDIGCYGGEVQTPALDNLAANGLKYTQFYNTARCCPSRASLLTGLHPHQTGIGHMMNDDGLEGYLGDLNSNCVTMAEALKAGGYKTYMSGKWHVTRYKFGEKKHNWPANRGFDDFWGLIGGAASYYRPTTLARGNEAEDPDGKGFFMTDRISDHAVRQITDHAASGSGEPFFQYVAYTAPHWPLHAHPEDIAKYKGRFDAGWDKLREERLERMKKMGILAEDRTLSDRDEGVGPWEDEENKEWQAKRMEIYAAQIDRMDQGIGRIVDALEKTGQKENTMIVFLADNGGCAEDIWSKGFRNFQEQVGWASASPTTYDGRDVRFGNLPEIIPGPDDTYASYGTEWANVSNTPFRYYKHWVHEGGISTPFIVHWPAGIKAKGQLRTQCAQLPDVMATFLDIAGADYPSEYNGKEIKPCEGISMVSTFADEQHGRDVLYWEHEGNKAVRKGDWKLVCRHPGGWELYDMAKDRSELNDVAADNPGVVEELSALYNEWAARCNVMGWDALIEHRKNKAN